MNYLYNDDLRKILYDKIAVSNFNIHLTVNPIHYLNLSLIFTKKY